MTTSTRSNRTRTGALITFGLLVVGLFGIVAWRAADGTLGLHRTPAPAATLTARAAALAAALSGDLNSGFLSPGHAYGGPFTEGTVVDQVEAQGGVLLAMGPTTGTTGNTATVMLGVGPSDASSTPACFSYFFTLGPDSVRQQSTACPDAATVALGRALLAKNSRADAGRQPSAPPGAYPVTVAGIRSLLQDRFARLRNVWATAKPATATAKAPTGTPVLVAAVRVEGVCNFDRLGSSTTITSWVPLWQAPLDDQTSCDAAHALAADTLYGRDAAQEG